MEACSLNASVVDEKVVESVVADASLREGEEVDVSGEDCDDTQIVLGHVHQLPVFLKGLDYAKVRRGLYFQYGLHVKDEESIPGLYMINYRKTNRTDGPEVCLTRDQEDLVGEYRGVIVEKETNLPVCYTFDRMLRRVPKTWDLKKCSQTRSYDGSQIKIFYHSRYNYWVVSTTRRIDASKSYFFSKKSFMELFQDASETLDWKKLNQNHCYSFVLGHPENHVVAKHTVPSLTHVLTRNMQTFEIVEEDIGVPKPERVEFRNVREMYKSLGKLNYWEEGYVVFNPETRQFAKAINNEYKDVKELRGQSNSLICHYFTLMKNGNMSRFLRFFPEYASQFNYFSSNFQKLCSLVMSEYVGYRIKKVITHDKVIEFLKPTLYNLHGIHLSTRQKIQIEDVSTLLLSYDPYQIRRLIELMTNVVYC